jgi:ABC-type sugar transport system substrate-binding protein
MRTRTLALLGAATLALGVAATPAEADPIRIAYLSPSFDISDAWERVFWAMQGRFDELGVDHEVQALAVATHVDHAGQLAQVEAVIAGGVDYVFLGPTEYEAAIPALRQLKQNDIPTVVYNYLEPHDEDARAMTYIAFDHADGGRLSGAWAANYLDGTGKVAVLLGAPGVISDERGGGFVSVMDLFPNIEVIMGPYTDFDRSQAFDAAQNLITAHEDLDLIYGISTTIGLGAGMAVRQAGLSDQIATMGFGGTGDEIVAMQEGWLTASVLRSIDDSGVAVADSFYAHMNGETPPQVWSGPFAMVDKDSDADEIVAHATRYSRPLMGR